MKLDKVIKKRRSIRKFKDKEIKHQDVEAILEAGIWAPSSGNSRPYKFYILNDRKKIDLFYDLATKSIIEWRKKNKQADEFYTEQDMFLKLDAYFKPIKKAPAHILIFFNLKKVAELNTGGSIEKFKENNYLYHSYRDSLHYTIQNMWLKATELGLASVYLEITRHMGENANKFLALGNELEYFSVLPIGYADEDPKREKRTIKNHLL